MGCDLLETESLPFSTLPPQEPTGTRGLAWPSQGPLTPGPSKAEWLGGPEGSPKALSTEAKVLLKRATHAQPSFVCRPACRSWAESGGGPGSRPA